MTTGCSIRPRRMQRRHQEASQQVQNPGQRHRAEDVLPDESLPLDLLLAVLGEVLGETEGYSIGQGGCAPVEGCADRLGENVSVEVCLAGQDPQVAKFRASPSFMRLLAMPSVTRASSFSATTV